MAAVYILESKKLNQFYIGSCLDFQARLADHQTGRYANAFTRRSDDWVPYFVLDGLSYHTARSIEKHIKKMKSRTFIINLKKYPELQQKLIDQYQNGPA